PRNVIASDGFYEKKIKITWDIVEPEAVYEVYRSESLAGEKTMITSLGWLESNTIHDVDSTLITTKDYYYWVRAKFRFSGSPTSEFSQPDIGYLKRVASTREERN
ncbi:MAG: hypothetical protein AAF990_14100, partial [Bacteroidota bacterium]